MEIFWIFILTVLIFGVLIAVHELGHFLAARLFKVKVNEFAIGMGPKLFAHKSKKSGTLYTIRLFPIGGYNSIEGEDGDSQDAGAFCSKPVWQRMIIILAGGIMNLLTGIIIMAVLVLGSKQYVSNQIDVFFMKDENGNYVTEYEGLRSGDIILKINNDRVHIAEEVSYSIFNQGYVPVDVTVERDGVVMVIEDVSFPVENESGIYYGVRNFYFNTEPKNFINTVKHTFYGSFNSVVQVFDSIKGLVMGKYSVDQLSGPIGVGGAIGEAAKMGADTVLNFVVLLSMNLGIFNLLPLPALDGGRFVFLVIEAIRRKPVPSAIEASIHSVGMILLLALAVFVAFKDIVRLL